MTTVSALNVSVEDQVYATNVDLSEFSIPPLLLMEVNNQLISGAKICYDVDDATRIIFPSYSSTTKTIYLTSMCLNLGTEVPVYTTNGIKIYLGGTV